MGVSYGYLSPIIPDIGQVHYNWCASPTLCLPNSTILRTLFSFLSICVPRSHPQIIHCHLAFQSCRAWVVCDSEMPNHLKGSVVLIGIHGKSDVSFISAVLVATPVYMLIYPV